MNKGTLLIIEDEEAIRDMIRFSFPTDEFELIDAENANQAMEILNNCIPSLIILDWMLPGKSGIDIIKSIKQRESHKNIPIIMLTAKAEEENKIVGLTSGADDYVTKPFSPRELFTRIKTVLRRGPLVSPEGEIIINDLVLNINKCELKIKNDLITLTPIEYKMIYFFMKNPNRTFTRDQLITQVWGTNFYIDDRTIDVNIRRLRNKLKAYHYHTSIKTIRSIGYLFTGKGKENENESQRTH